MSDLDLFPQGWLDAHLRRVVVRLRALPTELRPRLTGKRAFVNEYLDRPVNDGKEVDEYLDRPVNEWGVRIPNGRMLSFTFDEPETAQRYADRSEGSVVCRHVTEWMPVTDGEAVNLPVNAAEAVDEAWEQQEIDSANDQMALADVQKTAHDGEFNG